MDQQRLDQALTLLDQVLRSIDEAVSQLEELDRMEFIDVRQYIDQLYTLGGDLELEQSSLEQDCAIGEDQ